MVVEELALPQLSVLCAKSDRYLLEQGIGNVIAPRRPKQENCKFTFGDLINTRRDTRYIHFGMSKYNKKNILKYKMMHECVTSHHRVQESVCISECALLPYCIPRTQKL